MLSCVIEIFSIRMSTCVMVTILTGSCVARWKCCRDLARHFYSKIAQNAEIPNNLASGCHLKLTIKHLGSANTAKIFKRHLFSKNCI